MQKSKLTAEEILTAEKAKDDRVQSRKRGFAKMSERDRGWMRLSNDSLIIWHATPPEHLTENEFWAHPNIPEGMFLLDGKVYDAEEFRKALRWV